MKISRCNESLAGYNGIAIHGFLDAHGANLVQPFGKGSGKLGRHVLDHQHSRCIPGKPGQYLFNGIGSSGGSPDGNNFMGGC